MSMEKHKNYIFLVKLMILKYTDLQKPPNISDTVFQIHWNLAITRLGITRIRLQRG